MNAMSRMIDGIWLKDSVLLTLLLACSFFVPSTPTPHYFIHSTDILFNIVSDMFFYKITLNQQKQQLDECPTK